MRPFPTPYPELDEPQTGIVDGTFYRKTVTSGCPWGERREFASPTHHGSRFCTLEHTCSDQHKSSFREVKAKAAPTTRLYFLKITLRATTEA
jgi:hypothetical protein